MSNSSSTQDIQTQSLIFSSLTDRSSKCFSTSRCPRNIRQSNDTIQKSVNFPIQPSMQGVPLSVPYTCNYQQLSVTSYVFYVNTQSHYFLLPYLPHKSEVRKYMGRDIPVVNIFEMRIKPKFSLCVYRQSVSDTTVCIFRYIIYIFLKNFAIFKASDQYLLASYGQKSYTSKIHFFPELDLQYSHAVMVYVALSRVTFLGELHHINIYHSSIKAQG